MFWRIDTPLTLRPRPVNLPPAVAREYRLPESWVAIDALDGDRVLLPAVGDADCRSHDNVAIDFDPLRHEHQGFLAQRRIGTYVVWIPHFDGPRPERFFPPPAHLARTIPALGPAAYESLRAHMPLPPPETVIALSAAEAVACLARFEAASPFTFDKDDVARLDAPRVLAVTDADTVAIHRELSTFLEHASILERALRWSATAQVTAIELWLDLPHNAKPYTYFARQGDRWGFHFPMLGVAGFPPPT